MDGCTMTFSGVNPDLNMTLVGSCVENFDLHGFKKPIIQPNPNPQMRPYLKFELKRLKTERVFIGQTYIQTYIFK